MAPLVTVIIPVYNTGPWLKRCLDSVCSQTLTDIEIICVNDGSSDASASILQEYVSHDNRLQTITFSKNQGVSIARNVAIAAARGEWLGFVDSDDGIAPDFYEKLTSAATEGTQIVKGALWAECNAPRYINPDFNKQIRQNKFNFNHEWSSSIYRLSFIRENKISFLRGCTNGQDVAFLYDAVVHASAIEVIDDAIYNYFRRENSADSDYYTSKKVFGLIKMLGSLVNSLNKCVYDTHDYTSEFRRFLFLCTQISQKVDPSEAPILQQRIAATFLHLFEKCRHKDETLDSLDDDIADAIRAKDASALAKFISLSPQALLKEKVQARWRANRNHLHPRLRSAFKNE